MCISAIGCSSKEKKIDVNDYYYGNQREETSQEKRYLWNEENIPKETDYTENTGDYFDDPDFKPYMTIYSVPQGTQIKGAVLVSSGGAFMFRSENAEGKDIAEAFSKLGYISFVIHYRLQPYSERESGIDIARAVKMVRYYTKDYGVEENKIGLIGFSAGGIANGRTVLEFGQDINGNVIDNHYVPDQIDKVSSTANALIMAYSFYGRLSHANLEESTFKDFDLSPTYYVYGTEDPFYNQFNERVKLLKKLNKNIESQVLNNYPHGFGIQGDWAKDVDQWLDKIYE